MMKKAFNVLMYYDVFIAHLELMNVLYFLALTPEKQRVFWSFVNHTKTKNQQTLSRWWFQLVFYLHPYLGK